MPNEPIKVYYSRPDRKKFVIAERVIQRIKDTQRGCTNDLLLLFIDLEYMSCLVKKDPENKKEDVRHLFLSNDNKFPRESIVFYSGEELDESEITEEHVIKLDCEMLAWLDDEVEVPDGI